MLGSDPENLLYPICFSAFSSGAELSRMKVLCEGAREQLYAKFTRNNTIIVIYRGLFTNTQDVQNQTLQKQTFVCAKAPYRAR